MTILFVPSGAISKEVRDDLEKQAYDQAHTGLKVVEVAGLFFQPYSIFIP